MRSTALRIRVELRDAFGEVQGRVEFELPEEAAFKGQTFAEDFRAEVELGSMPIDGAVEIMSVKKFRRSLLVSEARRAGALLADHLEDREGWHGEERRERVEDHFRGKPKG